MKGPKPSSTSILAERRASAELTADRVESADRRALPHFIIAGCQRCGTTSLYWDLVKHPQVVAPLVKEIHYFDINWHEGDSWYRAHFPLIAELESIRHASAQQGITGEASPFYIFHPHAPRRLASTLPGARLIVLIRNPIDRAFSNYCRQVQKERESMSFEQAIDAEPQRLAGEPERMLDDEHYQSVNLRWYSYLARGMYADQLARLTAHIPRERVLVVVCEEYGRSPAAVYQRVLDFLDLPPFQPPQHEHRNRSKGPAIDPATRRRLVDQFIEPNRRLYGWLGRDLREFGWDQ